MAGRSQNVTAVGKAASTFPTAMVSVKDQAAHTKLKFRQVISTNKSIIGDPSNSSRQEQDRVATADSKTVAIIDEEKKVDTSSLLNGSKPIISSDVLKKYDDSDAIRDIDSDEEAIIGSSKNNASNSSSSSSSNRNNSSHTNPGDLSSIHNIDETNAPTDDDDSDDDDDEEDDELELQAELERIKAERAAASAKRELEEKSQSESILRESALKSNPLMDLSGGDGSAKIKRKWNDDVVFRNQARDEPEIKRRFINDTIRSDFHRSFLKRFIK